MSLDNQFNLAGSNVSAYSFSTESRIVIKPLSNATNENALTQLSELSTAAKRALQKCSINFMVKESCGGQILITDGKKCCYCVYGAITDVSGVEQKADFECGDQGIIELASVMEATVSGKSLDVIFIHLFQAF